MEEYLKKENYITVLPNLKFWKTHPNYKIMSFYSSYFKGVVADLGTNHGACTLLLLENKNITELNGYDMNYEALNVAYNLAIETNPIIPVHFVVANLCEMPVENNKFDAIQSFHTLEHIFPRDSQKFVTEAYRTLKHGGFFLLSIPYDHAYPDPAHVAFYNVDTMCELFENNGFETIECMKDNRWSEKNLLTGLFRKPDQIS